MCRLVGAWRNGRFAPESVVRVRRYLDADRGQRCRHLDDDRAGVLPVMVPTKIKCIVAAAD